jgi:novobiocin biosynthesis protein NovU/D-mycarose 3-C-methyltransferase
LIRTHCRACRGTDLRQVIDLGPLPLAGGFLADQGAIATEKLYPLQVHSCASCGLVQVLNPVDPDILFQDYSFSSSTIKPLVDHFVAYAQWLSARLAPKKVVEFGCNDGVLLGPLAKAGIQAIGVDISQNIGDIARGKGLDVVTGYFDVDTARTIRERVGAVDVVTGSNAFAHNDSPEVILEAANTVLSDDGYLCLEFMYAGDLLDQLQWDTLYHEHLTFYNLSALRILLLRHGFYVVDAERLPMHGGSLRVCASRKAKELTAGAEQVFKYEEDVGLGKPETWQRFAGESLRRIGIVKDVFQAVQQRNRVWAYGAAGKATMWVNACKMNYLGGVVDASPLRAGKFMPGTHTPIVFPEAFRAAAPDYIFVTAWNYADLIRSKESWFQGVWSVPLPDLRFF